MLVRPPLLTSHKWRELVSSGRSVCRCHDVFLWCYVCSVLLRFRLYAFVEAAAFRSIVLRYAGAPIATRVSFFLFFVCFGDVAFSEYFCTISAFSLYGEYTGWIFYISSTIGEGGETTISSPARSPKQPLPGMRLHDPLHGRQACPEFIAFDQGVSQTCPRLGLFSYHSLPNRDKYVTSQPTPQSLNCQFM